MMGLDNSFLSAAEGTTGFLLKKSPCGSSGVLAAIFFEGFPPLADHRTQDGERTR